MKLTKLIIVSGFLGSGKTTLLWKTAQLFINQGLSVGLITNDQAPELVDSKLLRLNKLHVSEVSGSCFCCNFNGFTDAILNIRNYKETDIIIAEPVGSCTDLSATLMQPIKKYWNREIKLMPLTVLADPNRLQSILNGGNGQLHTDAAYIYKKQLEESDIIIINKIDLLSDQQMQWIKQKTTEYYPNSYIMTASAKKQSGIQQWLNHLQNHQSIGQTIVKMDYNIYARGEAVLGWLNGTISITGEETDWDNFTNTFLTALANQFDKQNMNVGHVKVITLNQDQYMVGNITGKVSSLKTQKRAGKSRQAQMIINARVETSPDILNKLIKKELKIMCKPSYQTKIIAWQYLKPGKPKPTHRFSKIQ